MLKVGDLVVFSDKGKEHLDQIAHRGHIVPNVHKILTKQDRLYRILETDIDLIAIGKYETGEDLGWWRAKLLRKATFNDIKRYRCSR